VNPVDAATLNQIWPYSDFTLPRASAMPRNALERQKASTIVFAVAKAALISPAFACAAAIPRKPYW